MISILVVGGIVAFFVLKRRSKRSSPDIEKINEPFAPLASNEKHGKTNTLFCILFYRCGEVCAEYAKTFYLGTFSFLFSFFLCFIGSDLLSYYPCLFYDKGIVFFDYFFWFSFLVP